MLLKQNLSLYRVFRITWKIDIIMLLLCTAAYLEDTFVLPGIHVLPTLPALIGTAIAFFIAFNNNQAYSRWWEARIIWGGLVNDSRSWTRNLLAYSRDEKANVRMIRRHIGFLYALKAALRRTPDEEFMRWLPPEEVAHVSSFSNIANAILDIQAADLQQLSDRGVIDGFRFRLFDELIRSFCDGMGKSERINNTVFPTTYIYFTRLFIWILVVLTTLTLSESIGPWSIFFGWIIGFVFHTSHINGMSLMNPFEPTASGIALNAITRTVEINALESLGDPNVPEPEPAQHGGEYLL